MQNEIITPKTIDDKLIVASTMSDKELLELCKKLEINIPLYFVRKIADTLETDKTALTEDILKFFSALTERSTENIESIAPSELYAENAEITNTLRNLYTKAEQLGIFKGEPLKINDMLKVVSQYLKCVGAHEPRLLTEKIYADSSYFDVANSRGQKMASIMMDLSPALPYGYVKNTVKKSSHPSNRAKSSGPALVHGIELILLCDNDGAFNEKYTALSADERFGKLCISSAEIGAFGIIGAVTSLAVGAHINFDKLSFNDLPLSVEQLVSEKAFVGCRIVAAAISSADKLTSLIEEYGICPQNFAKALEQPYIILTDEIGMANIKTSLITEAIDMSDVASLKAAAETFKQTKAKDDLFLVGKDGNRLALNGVAKLSDGSSVCARYTNTLSFTSAVNTVIDTLFELFSRGADRKKTELSIKIGASRDNITGIICAILGAYRVMSELSIPEAQSKVEFSQADAEEENYILCIAAEKETELDHNIQSTLGQNSVGNSLYLISFSRNERSSPAYMPDFASLRTACDNLYTLMSDGTAVSARAFNGSIAQAVRSIMPEDQTESLAVAPSGKIPITDTLFMQGFLVEVTQNKSLNLPLVGRITRNDTANDSANANAD